MLVLTRKADEAIRVDDMRVVVIEIRGDRVRLGVEAPQAVPINREEVWTQL